MDRSDSAATVDRTAECAAALRLESNHFLEAINQARVIAAREVNNLRTKFGGMAQGNGRFHVLEAEAQLDALLGAIQAVIQDRRNLGRRCTPLLSDLELEVLKTKLCETVDSWENNIQESRARQDRAWGGDSSAVNRALHTRVSAMKGTIDRDIENLKLETQLGLNTEPQAMVWNINNSIIANLNLGTVMGDLSASIQTLSAAGHDNLGQAIKTLAEAIASTSEIHAEQQKELMEHLDVVATQSVAKPEVRKTGPLKASINALREGLALAKPLVELWSPIVGILRDLKVIE